MKGKVSLFQSKEIIWNEIIDVFKNIWDFFIIIGEVKSIFRDLENVIVSNKEKLKNRASYAKILINFINYKTTQELKNFMIEDRTRCVPEFNKMIIKNSYMKNIEKSLKEVKDAVLRFNVLFDKRKRAGFPYCWDQQGNILPWETFETLMVKEKSKIGDTHEKNVILKGATIVNFLHKDFQLLWIMKTLFS